MNAMRFQTGRRGAIGTFRVQRSVAVRAGDKTAAVQLSRLPEDYSSLITQAQKATQKALADGATLLEVEFPPTAISSVAGDGEGANEMTASMTYLRTFISIFNREAESIRIFFPDVGELKVAREGKGKDPAAGSWDLEPRFAQSKFKLDYLTKPTGLMDFGLDINKFNCATRAKETDKMFVVAYPHFNPGEMVAVKELWAGAAKKDGKPIIVFNGELDRIRSGYYPPLFYPKIGKLAKEFIPKFEQAYYIHNFKGSHQGTLFRVYPEPWQVIRRGLEGSRVVWTGEAMPTLKEVALNILPNAK